MATFKKLFSINYNNKKYLILVSNNHRKTFLEMTKDGKYLYPEYKDFVALDQIYNNYDYTIKYNEKSSKHMTYEEKVRYKTALLLLITSTFMFGAKSIIQLGKKNDSLNVDYQLQYESSTCNADTLSQFYGDDVITKDDVVKVINANDKLSDKYKQMAIDVLNNNLELDPTANLRIFYENMKYLEIVHITTDEMSHNGTTRASACFNAKERRIYLTDDNQSTDRQAFHELTHAFHELIDFKDNDTIYIFETYGYSLAEAMTEKIANNKYNYSYNYYGAEQRLLNFFLNNVDNFNYHTYNENGIVALINELKGRYPDVDIDYLIDYIDNFTTTYIYDIENTYKLYEDEDFCNELFKIAINNIDQNNIYKSLDNFIDALGNSSLYEKYYVKYNDALVNQGILNYEQLNKIDSICIINGELYFSNSGNSYIDYSGKETNIDKSMNAIFLPIDTSVKNKIIQIMVNGNINIFSSKFIDSVLDDYELYTTDFYDELNKLDDATKIEIVNSVFKLKVANIDEKNLYANFGTIVNFMECDYDLFYNTQKYDEYFKMYDNELVKKGFVNQKQIDCIRNAVCIVKCIDKEYLLDDYCYGYFSMMVDETQLGDVYTIFTLGDALELKYINDVNRSENIKVDTDVLELLKLSNYEKNLIIQYAADNNIENVTSQAFLNKLDAEFEIFKNKKYNTFSDGSLAFDDITDSMYVEIGIVKENTFGLMLYDGDKLIYETCQNFASPTAKIPFEKYLQLIRGYQYNYLDQIISADTLLSISPLLLEYLIPNLDIDYEEVAYSYNGESFTRYETSYKLNEPVKMFVDGSEFPLRSIFLYQDQKYDLILHLPNGNKIVIGNLLDSNYWFISDHEVYFTFFDTFLKHFNILPDENNIYSFTTDEIINIVNNYVNNENINGYKR